MFYYARMLEKFKIFLKISKKFHNWKILYWVWFFEGVICKPSWIKNEFLNPLVIFFLEKSFVSITKSLTPLSLVQWFLNFLAGVTLKRLKIRLPRAWRNLRKIEEVLEFVTIQTKKFFNLWKFLDKELKGSEKSCFCEPLGGWRPPFDVNNFHYPYFYIL